jgi:hypothetical protein
VQQSFATPYTPPSIISRMADFMRRREASSGACTERDLTAEGFKPFDIAAYGERAAALAARKAERSLQEDPREPVAGQAEPLVLQPTPGSRPYYVAGMVAALRQVNSTPQTRNGCLNTLTKGLQFPQDLVEDCLEEVYATLHPHACDLKQRRRRAPAAVNAYALPLVRAR